MVEKSFPDIFQHVQGMYSEYSPLVFNKDVNPFCCHFKVFSEGISLVLFFFSLTIHPLLLDLQQRHSSVQVLAYLDDVFLLGSLEDVSPALDDLRDQFSEVGLSVAMNKCEIYSRGRFVMCNSHESIRVSSSETKILGTPIGQPEYVKSSCSDIA